MPTVEELTLSGLLPHLVREESGWTATWRALTLHSVFQPVLSITHQRIVGYEALLRAFDPVGLPVTPDVLFSGTRSASEARELDRIARCLQGPAEAELLRAGRVGAMTPHPRLGPDVVEHADHRIGAHLLRRLDPSG